MVMVVAVIAMFAILITIILSMSVMNYRMKTTNQKSTLHFYAVEEGVDEVKAGLTQQLSQASMKAYQEVMENFATTDETQRTMKFTNCVKEELLTALADDTKKFYDLEVLNSFLKEHPYDSLSKQGILVTTNQTQGATLEVEKNKLTLKNIVVTCYGENSYMSQIKTDMELLIPSINLSQKAGATDLLSYSLIANRSFVVGESTGLTDIQIQGNTYLGKEGVNINNSSLSFAKDVNENILITNGTFSMTNGSKVRMNGIQMWTRELLVDSSEYRMDGTMYLADDMVLANHAGSSSSRPEVKAILEGKYYGFGNEAYAEQASSVTKEEVAEDPAGFSSALVVNGVNTTVDLSGLEEMYLAGNAYVNTTARNGELKTKNTDVATGESISVKSNQTAYLIPTQCVAPGTENGGLNPMPMARYEALLEELGENVDAMVDYDQVLNSLGKSLSDLGVHSYEKQCYPVQKIGTMVYLFMEFDSQQRAAEYANLYFNQVEHAEQLKWNLDTYTEELILPENQKNSENGANFYYNGSILMNDKSKENITGLSFGQVSEEQRQQWISQSTSNWDSFFALNHKLVKQYSSLSETEKQKDVYNNLVKSMTSTDLGYTISEGETRTFIGTGENALAAIVVNGNYTLDTTTIEGMDQNGEGQIGRLCLVIASGDVRVDCDFQGTILAGGTITITKNGVSISSEESNVSAVMNVKNQAGYCASDYLVNGSSYSTEDISSTTGKTIDFTELVTYQNWSKQ